MRESRRLSLSERTSNPSEGLSGGLRIQKRSKLLCRRNSHCSRLNWGFSLLWRKHYTCWFSYSICNLYKQIFEISLTMKMPQLKHRFILTSWGRFWMLNKWEKKLASLPITDYESQLGWRGYICILFFIRKKRDYGKLETEKIKIQK